MLNRHKKMMHSNAILGSALKWIVVKHSLNYFLDSIASEWVCESSYEAPNFSNISYTFFLKNGWDVWLCESTE